MVDLETRVEATLEQQAQLAQLQSCVVHLEQLAQKGGVRAVVVADLALLGRAASALAITQRIDDLIDRWHLGAAW
jgi:ribosomal protein L7Ae-like RNA K-turn-binding protein